MTSRAATDTIKGYFYQFDYSISRLLELVNDTDKITIEGIEDIDINTLDAGTAIQCKYYAKTEYNHSVIGEPIRYMLNHYKKAKTETKPLINYYLYGHYKGGHEKLLLPLTVDFLKKHYLSYTRSGIKYVHHEELGLSDTDLNEFISRLSINIYADEYEEQYKNLLEQLILLFNCSLFEAENFYYNNALKVIKELAVQHDIESRTITKSDFIKQINHKQFLFNEWLSYYKGKKALLRNLRNEFFSSLNTSPFERFFLLEINNVENLIASVKEMIVIISTKWSNISRRMSTPFCPYIYLHNINADDLVLIKHELQQEGFNFTDGYSFMGSSFSVDLMCAEANAQNGIRFKLINTLEDFEQVLKSTRKRKEIYQFFNNSTFYNTDTPGTKHVKIQYEEFKDIREVI